MTQLTSQFRSLVFAFTVLLPLGLASCRRVSTPSPTAILTPRPPPTFTPSPTPDPLVIDGANLPSLVRLATATESWPNALAWSPDSSVLAIADMDGIWFRDARTLAQRQFIDVIDSLRGEVVGSTVWAIAYSPNADLVATDVSGSGFRILLWKPGQDTPLRRLQGHDDGIRDLVFTPDGSRLVSASADGSVRVWNLETGATLCELKNHWDWVDSLDISADGSRLVSAGYDAVINIWDPDTCELLVALQDQYIIDGVAISPDGRLIAAGERDEAIHLFDDKGNLLRLLVGHEEWDVNDVDFSHQGDLLVSAGSDGTVRFWDTETGSILRVLPIGSEVTSARFSPDGHYVAVGSGMGEGVEVWGLPAP